MRCKASPNVYLSVVFNCSFEAIRRVSFRRKPPHPFFPLKTEYKWRFIAPQNRFPEFNRLVFVFLCKFQALVLIYRRNKWLFNCKEWMNRNWIHVVDFELFVRKLPNLNLFSTLWTSRFASSWLILKYRDLLILLFFFYGHFPVCGRFFRLFGNRNKNPRSLTQVALFWPKYLRKSVHSLDMPLFGLY